MFTNSIVRTVILWVAANELRSGLAGHDALPALGRALTCNKRYYS